MAKQAALARMARFSISIYPIHTVVMILQPFGANKVRLVGLCSAPNFEWWWIGHLRTEGGPGLGGSGLALVPILDTLL